MVAYTSYELWEPVPLAQTPICWSPTPVKTVVQVLLLLYARFRMNALLPGWASKNWKSTPPLRLKHPAENVTLVPLAEGADGDAPKISTPMHAWMASWKVPGQSTSWLPVEPLWRAHTPSP